ncbi:MAG: threonylcarbamoyl-AMP synthase [Planctomycetes bacterium]|nr:threonylcarbamoyl-AMP synthase [Planctomycetota bacterium]
MDTLLLKLDSEKFDPEAVAPAAAILREGGIVAFPTETVYGLAVNLDLPASVDRLLELRGSPKDKPMTIHVASLEQAARIAKIPPCGVARRLIRRLWPGPLTLVFPSEDGRGVGLRWPHHKLACELIRRAGVRVGAPSANLAGEPPATDGAEAARLFMGRVECVIDAGPTHYRAPSTVARVGPRGLELLREGAIPSSLMQEIGGLTVLFVCSGNTCRSPIAEHMFRRMLARRLQAEEGDLEARGIRVSSCGTSAAPGALPMETSIEALREIGLDLSKHRARPATAALVEEADRIFVMTRRHQQALSELVPECAAHIEMLDPEGQDIEDPYGGDVEMYRECARKIRTCLEKRLAEF